MGAGDRGHQRDEFGMVANRRRPFHPHSAFAADTGRLDVEVVEHFDVIAEEADRRDDRDAALPNLVQLAGDVGFEPGVPRTPAAALKGERP